MSELPSCVSAPELVPTKRYSIWTYATDWDGWTLRFTTDDRTEAEAFMRLHDERQEFFPGIVLTECLCQHIRPQSSMINDNPSDEIQQRHFDVLDRLARSSVR